MLRHNVGGAADERCYSIASVYSGRANHSRSVLLVPPGWGTTTSTLFQEMAEDIQTYIRDQMPM